LKRNVESLLQLTAMGIFYVLGGNWKLACYSFFMSQLNGKTSQPKEGKQAQQN
jgi:hypothetical protein